MGITTEKKQILVDGKSTLVLSAEFHYFRCDPENWEATIEQIKESGCNAIATYIPWCLHEMTEGIIDLEGHTNPRLNLKKYLELVEKHDMFLTVRPGPFVMAELINDGTPNWLRKKYPDLIPTTWDNGKATTVTLDYTAPEYLAASRVWYKAVNALLSQHIYPKGKIVGYQLDNEIGMLSWVSNCPDLTIPVLTEFREYLLASYEQKELEERYPVDFDNFDTFVQQIRSPQDSYGLELHKDLGYYMRQRIVNYVNTLRAWAEEDNIKDIPLMINIHGCGGGRAFPYPIGISQLYKAYEGVEGIISGSDIYLDNVDVPLLSDWYMINVLTDATNSKEQPLTSLEFSVGDNDYGYTYSRRAETHRADFAIRMYVAQDNKMLNYYTFCSGTNYRVEEENLGNGTDRIASTGEQHGFAAPIKFDRSVSYTYHRMQRASQLMLNLKDKLATAFEDTDNLKYGFIPDYFMTEYHYKDSERNKEMIRCLEDMRTYHSWDTAIKGFLLNNVSFKGLNIQDKDIDGEDVLFVPSARYMAAEVQQKLADFLITGGKALIYGEVPLYDMEGNDCRILMEALDLTHLGFGQVTAHGFNYSIQAVNSVEGPFEYHVHRVQTLKPGKNTEVLLKVYHNQEDCGFDIQVGKGRCVVITTHYNTNLDFYQKIYDKLGITRKLQQDYDRHGIFMTSSVNAEDERFVTVLNLDNLDKEFNVTLDDENILGEPLYLNATEGVLLPLNVKVGKVTVKHANCEIYDYNDNQITFRLVGKNFKAVFESDVEITSEAQDVQVSRNGNVVEVTKAYRNYGEDYITLNI
ncbi:MAG: beta-galactosidase [Cellulosilyticaceae bacterium]